MVRRLFWMSVGAAGGIYVLRQVTRRMQAVSDAVSPSGLAAGAHVVGDAVREFAYDVQHAMQQRERELRDALGLEDSGGVHSEAVAYVDEGFVDTPIIDSRGI